MRHSAGPPSRTKAWERAELLLTESRTEARGYATRVAARLDVGELVHADSWQEVGTLGLFAQLAKEAADLAGWALLTWQAAELDAGRRRSTSLDLALRYVIACAAEAHWTVEGVLPVLPETPESCIDPSAPRRPALEQALLAASAQSPTFVDHVTRRLSYGEDRHAARWTTWGTGRLLRETTIEAIDIGAWALLALQAGGASMDYATQARRAMCSGARAFTILDDLGMVNTQPAVSVRDQRLA